MEPDEFLDWLHAVERVFNYKDILEDKKVKLVTLRLRRYTSLWWANHCAMRAKRGKSRIRTWAKSKSKLKDKFLLASYL